MCPLFFRVGEKDILARLCADAHFEAVEQHRLAATLAYADADEAYSAAFEGGPVALAWSRFGADVRAGPWHLAFGYQVRRRQRRDIS